MEQLLFPIRHLHFKKKSKNSLVGPEHNFFAFKMFASLNPSTKLRSKEMTDESFLIYSCFSCSQLVFKASNPPPREWYSQKPMKPSFPPSQTRAFLRGTDWCSEVEQKMRADMNWLGKEKRKDLKVFSAECVTNPLIGAAHFFHSSYRIQKSIYKELFV